LAGALVFVCFTVFLYTSRQAFIGQTQEKEQTEDEA